MYREDTKHYTHYNFVFHQGGLGDVIAQLPIIKYCLDYHDQIYIHLWIHDYAVDLCKKVFSTYDNITVKGMSLQKTEYNDKLLARSPYAHKITNLSSHLTDHGFYTIAHRQVDNNHKNYIQLDPIDVSEFNLPKKYVVITTGFTSQTREWLPEHVNGVTQYCIDKGYTPVYLGKSYTQSYLTTGITGKFKANYENGINLIDKTNLFEAHSIMNGGFATLGVDNGLLHLNSMGKAPAIWGFTTVDPIHRLPYKDGIMGKNCLVVTPDSKKLGCTFCQSNLNFAPESHTFTKCFYGDYKCLEEINAEKWIQKLKELGMK